MTPAGISESSVGSRRFDSTAVDTHNKYYVKLTLDTHCTGTTRSQSSRFLLAAS